MPELFAHPEIKPQGMFLGRPLIGGLWRVLGLRNFLVRDAGQTVFCKSYSITNGTLHLRLALDGNGKFVKDITGLTGLNQIFTAVREEPHRQFGRVKVLYGWENINDWGIVEKARIKYVLAGKKNSEAEWHLREKPLALKGLTEFQKARIRNQRLIRVLTEGTAGKVFEKWWKVVPHRNTLTGELVDGNVYYQYSGVEIRIYGFKDHKRVFSVIREEGNQIIARFYKNKDDAAANLDLIKEAVLSRDKKPLRYPVVTFTAPSAPVQHGRIESERIHDFLLADQPPGARLDLAPRCVNFGREVNFSLGSTEKERKTFRLNGYHGHKIVYGRIVVKKNIKRVYFWPSAEDRKKRLSPIVKDGHILARKEDDKWSILLTPPADADWLANYRETLAYRKFLLTTKHNEVHLGLWPVRFRHSDGRMRKYAARKILGMDLSVALTAHRKVEDTVFAATREIGGRIKVVEFWPTAQDFAAGADALAARFITFRTNSGENGNGWIPFWSELDDLRMIQRLVKMGGLTLAELNGIVTDPRMESCYHREMLRLIDHFELFDTFSVITV